MFPTAEQEEEFKDLLIYKVKRPGGAGSQPVIPGNRRWTRFKKNARIEATDARTPWRNHEELFFRRNREITLLVHLTTSQPSLSRLQKNNATGTRRSVRDLCNAMIFIAPNFLRDRFLCDLEIDNLMTLVSLQRAATANCRRDVSAETFKLLTQTLHLHWNRSFRLFYWEILFLTARGERSLFACDNRTGTSNRRSFYEGHFIGERSFLQGSWNTDKHFEPSPATVTS